MIIENREQRIIHFDQSIPPTKEHPYATSETLFRLAPGLNIIDGKHWNVAKEDSVFKYKLKKRMLVVADADDTPLEKRDAETVMDILSGVFDYLALQKFAKSDSEVVAKAAKKQMDVIDAYTGPAKSDDGEVTVGGRSDTQSLGADLPVNPQTQGTR